MTQRELSEGIAARARITETEKALRLLLHREGSTIKIMAHNTWVTLSLSSEEKDNMAAILNYRIDTAKALLESL